MNTPLSPDRTVVLFGAPRTSGATGTLCDLFLSTCGGNVTVIDCFACGAAPCDDCGGCKKATRCVKHDMDAIYDAIEQATRLVFVTPVYNRSFPAPMKAVIDRLQCYWSRRFVHGIKPPVATPKTAVLLTVCGSERDDGLCVQTQLEPTLTILNVTDTKVLHVSGTDGEVDWNAVAEQLNAL